MKKSSIIGLFHKKRKSKLALGVNPKASVYYVIFALYLDAIELMILRPSVVHVVINSYLRLNGIMVGNVISIAKRISEHFVRQNAYVIVIANEAMIDNTRGGGIFQSVIRTHIAVGAFLRFQPTILHFFCNGNVA